MLSLNLVIPMKSGLQRRLRGKIVSLGPKPLITPLAISEKKECFLKLFWHECWKMHLIKRDGSSRMASLKAMLVWVKAEVEDDELDPVAGVMNEFDQLMLQRCWKNSKLVAPPAGSVSESVLNTFQVSRP